MDGGERKERVDSASRVILATPRQLFRTFFDAETLKAWRVPEGAAGIYSVLEPQPGGRFRLDLVHPDRTAPDGTEAEGYTIEGRFTEFLPDERVIEEIRLAGTGPVDAGVMTLTISIELVQAGSKVTMQAIGMPRALEADAHRAALAASLRRLALLTE